MDLLTSFLGRNGFLPHGYCFTWSPSLLWSMVGADAVITAAYFSIPLAIMSYTRQRPDVPHRPLAWLFSAFILACGLTHAMDIWTIWQPDYGLQALTKVTTAVVSLLTAVMLWRLIPQALRIPSAQQLAGVISSLEAEVAQRRSAEEHLAETEQSLALTLDSIGAGFIATDRQGLVRHMNAVAEQILGWQLAQAQGHSIWEVFEREGRVPDVLARNPVDALIEIGYGMANVQHVVAVARDGRRTSVEVKAALNRTSDGTVRGLAVVFRDMTQQMQADAVANRLAALVESSNDAIVSTTLDGRITTWNRAAEALFGYSAAEAIGQPVQMLIPPDRQHEELRILAELARGQRVATFDTQRLRRDGQLVDISLSLSPIHDTQGRIVGASKIATDITQRRLMNDARRLAERLEAENQQIQEANRLKSLFLANMSHELRTPLNAVIGFADLLHAGAVPADSPKHQQYLGHIGSSGRHLLQLINDVLDLAKVESGKFEFFPEPVDLPALVREVLEVQLAAIQRKRLEVSTELDPALTGLVLDAARFKQALYNYISNAIKFTPEGGRIVVRARPEGAQRFRLEVQDSGVGIAAGDLARLFTEFHQLDAGPTKRHQGTGLGLALTRRLVQAQGGSVGVRSTLGAGSVFHLVLDRVCGRATEPGSGSPSPWLLVVAPDEQRQARMLDGLAGSGLAVDVAGSRAVALQQAQARAYSALSLDLVLPDESGLALLAQIRAGGPSREAPVLGMAMTATSGAAAAFHIADVLAKPIRTQEVVLAMSRLAGAGVRPRRVLVVDDDPLALDLMGAVMAGLGITAAFEPGGREALSRLDLHQPDAIILDLMMPGFDGFATLDALRQLPAWRETPVFIWTSMILTEAEVALLSQSASAILHKGGGLLEPLLESLRRWRPAAVLPVGGS